MGSTGADAREAKWNLTTQHMKYASHLGRSGGMPPRKMLHSGLVQVNGASVVVPPFKENLVFYAINTSSKSWNYRLADL